ncbi:uncharacterized protein LOC123702662 [Colias croceus]|uniref:uncharacterized protein LOC123702662 n=1 Tax=Colias crocea TaxID=72248 RepID=UPI001E27B2C1|nr:uncharacterized protein LOC123702662 [Colias croceus]
MNNINLISFNCKNVTRSVECVRQLCRSADVVALQETWLMPHDLGFLAAIDDDFACTGTSAVDTSAGVLRGRSYGGVALLWRKVAFPTVTVVKCNSVRLAAIKIELSDRSILIFSVYMPTESNENLVEFTECLSEMTAIIDSHNVQSVFMLGDYNAHPGESFATELLTFCAEQSWSCVDLELMPADSHTFVSDAHGCRRWLDHCLVTSAARQSVSAAYNMYDEIISILSEAAISSYNVTEKRRCKYITGWNRHVRGAHEKARLCFQAWLYGGKPGAGRLYDDMCETRRTFKSKLKWCQNNQQQIKMDIIAELHSNKKFGQFWKNTNKMNHKPGLPVSVAGVHEPSEIATLFSHHFRVDSPLGPARQGPDAEEGGERSVYFTTKEVRAVIKGMVRGKSPGHDSLSIEHLQHAGVHLPRVLAMFFTMCLGHSHLPDNLMRTIVVPIIKNKTGDTSDVNNYRPISLATVVAKVLDSLLGQHLDKHVSLNDAQFGFRPGLSTESAILCLKQTVQYYTSRKTPVYACYLDLSKAFDLVSYDILWGKLRNETCLPREIVKLFMHWYNNQKNFVRWAGSLSGEYGLECGVRQGGLTSPMLFSLYVNRLIDELSSTGIGCHIDGVCMNNISYADDMVLLSPSIGALRRLLKICESYAVAHGLKYNAKKSEIMIFRPDNKRYTFVPNFTLSGTALNKVEQFKYLGHWVTEDLKDSVDIERERRALSVRCNMLARRFSRCTGTVKVALFKAYCQSFYTCSLWVNYTQRTYSDLRVQYNNAFRVLMGLPRHCSASAMFAAADTDGFAAIMRKRCASIMRRTRDSPNTILRALADRWDSPMLARWIRLHAVV